MKPLSISGYQLSEEIYSGSRTLVYRGVRETDSLPVVIKLLKNSYPSFNELMQFRNQYAIAKHLHSPLIIQTYSLEAYQNGYALVMEDFGGISLKDYFTTLKTSQTNTLQEFLLIAIALCNGLEILYRNQIIHKDIKPSNILINPQTKQVKLIDFSIASLLPRETQTLMSPNVLQGTLAYISPEQTGRMNRGIDYRTDFYSLGVTFYELLTGKLPFQSNDLLELVHCHLAKGVPLVHEINPRIPPVLSDIIEKLMAKNAEDRYQSALGLKFDLENCRTQLNATGRIDRFEIAQGDVCDRFLIPEKLYGRETEVKTLLQAFERVSNGSTEMMLVAGFSGIGKTAVVNEVHKPIVKQRGYFIKGKFDQFQRNVPLSGFVQAFRDLMGQLLTENDSQIQEWKSKILQAVGENGQVIIEVIPELEKIIGQQLSAQKLFGTEAQNRFNLLFQKFTQVFTSAKHPLVIFLDDLQWADSASLNLIQLFMANTGHLLLIGAYRDNEVTPAHPLILTLNEIRKKQATINTITLKPLNHVQLNQLVADTLKCTENLAWTLSELVYQKTEGNPFFATQFLKALYQDELIQFNFELGCWECDITEVTQQAVTNDVVAFMAFQLQRLPEKSQNILQLAACIGNQFDLATLAIVSKNTELETATCLWQALQEGLILPIDDVYKFYVGQAIQPAKEKISQSITYKFLHDRVQQAAYSLIPDEQKKITHYRIGQQLLKNTTDSEKEKRIFEIVNQINVAVELVEQAQEREELAALNLIAGRKAKNSTAYSAAVKYFAVGRNLLASDRWESQYNLALELYVEATEAAYLNTDIIEMERLAETVLQHAKTPLDTVKVYALRTRAYTSQGELLKAISTGLTILKEFEIDLPASPSLEDVARVRQETQTLLSGRKPADLLNLPEMTNPQILAVMHILQEIGIPTYLTQPNLNSLIIMVLMNLSMNHGNISISALGYSTYGLFLGAVAGDIEQGYEFGELALNLLSKFKDKKIESRILFITSVFIVHWKVHARETLKLLQNAYSTGWETGSLMELSYAAYGYGYHAYFIGYELPKLEQEITAYSKVLEKLHQQTQFNYNEVYRQIVLNLLDQTACPYILFGEPDKEQEFLARFQQTNDKTGLWHFFVNKLILCYWFQEFELALEFIERAKHYSSCGKGMFNIAAFNFYASLTWLAVLPKYPKSEQENILRQVTANQKNLQEWTSHNPYNHLHKFYLVEAERSRVLGQYLEAMKNYDLAIFLAKENGYIQEEGLSNELCAKFYLDWGKEKIAQTYMQEAYYCYARWGAKAKIDALLKHYPQLLQHILQQQQINLNPLETIAFDQTLLSTRTSSNSSSSIADLLDFTSVLKASQAISSSLQIDQLITSLTHIILENSGAKKSILILPQAQQTADPFREISDHTWEVKAITLLKNEEMETILTPQSLEDCQDIPTQIINYVKNTQKTVVIDNCKTDIPGVIDKYMLEHQPQSVLCAPIINQRNLVGIIYLENQLTAGVFTSARLSVIHLLSSQAAISLENARLYQESQDKAQQLYQKTTQLEQTLQHLQQTQLQLVQSEKMSALGNLVAGVAHEMNNPLGFISASIVQAKPILADIFEHLKLYQTTLQSPSDEIIEHAEEIDLDYSLEDLPKMIDSMRVACDRLTNISNSLRTFSRDDKDHKVPFNIHSGIDSTILILKHRLKANEQRPTIEVNTNYGDLPEIECFSGQLNQVFMNILANAIDALEESNIGRSLEEIKANPNKITITTSVMDNQVKIAIADNGIGMNEQVKQKIFDHLFTTKLVGKGTGLGLAIARQIVVEKHHGTMTVNSTLGKGTEFVISLPFQ
ncbi:trifunctional serine/threonine-protein kinase/ATP-binding protein/sensor histidine kinase [Aetokthonos hydrillicola Thurmond2011]|jgi:predicted ATPase/signal transduction histidine kinase|uniref:histidine kinase n=1 Tax=Aetokthonos hydrillicola Thurmond2011 TaxID=2712845 RepID=A0AAP5M9C1_9CYAN|nr:ATP-binding sensor histidine kinase [Aetokthonos hydrillicola]MBO3459600.1 AAA family ATPase [Aetokthonos hydrillicola CCALA 1050]MBW4588962.1 AAA family ATPase [Aetokthonos hydrillicola CCALA 1050]MDR9900036.1 trifunctional serine/threonine-protein kinase/ATP-binding protein/sensor histidine kinase [Aetokthonos hydrillicola Thurmond2011]